MKATKEIIIVLLTIFTYSFSQAQEDRLTTEQWLFEHKKQISNTPYIFEGTVLQQKRFKARDGELITCNITTITKIYKGSPQIKLGTIKLMVGTGLVESNGFTTVIADANPYTLGGKGSTYIIIARLAGSHMLCDSMAAVDNSTILTTYGCDYPIHFIGNFYNDDKLQIPASHDTIEWEGTPQFKTLDNIEVFFKENGLTVQEEIEKK